VAPPTLANSSTSPAIAHVVHIFFFVYFLRKKFCKTQALFCCKINEEEDLYLRSKPKIKSFVLGFIKYIQYNIYKQGEIDRSLVKGSLVK
jgi:hypothetical protein